MTQATPAVEGWFTTGAEPALLGSRCTTCTTVFFPPSGLDGGGYCRNPACDGEEFAQRRAVAARPDLELHRRAVPAAAALHPGHRPLRAVRARGGRARRGDRGARPGRRTATASTTSKVGDEVELVVETLYTDETGDRTIWRWKPVVELGRGGRPVSTNDVAVAGVGMHPWGKWGKNFVTYGVARRPRRAGRRRHPVAGRRPDRRRRDRAQRLRRLRRRRDLRPGARLERRPRRHVVRRLRDRRPGPRHRPGPDPRRPVRGRAGRRRRHHAEGLPGAQRRRAVGRPRLAALPAARHDQPGVLRALRAPPDGPVRRHPARTSRRSRSRTPGTAWRTPTRATARRSASRTC